jgi:hypothetical protein
MPEIIAETRETLQRVLGQFPIGRDLAAEDRKHRRNFEPAVDLKYIVPGHRRRILGAIVIERPRAGEGMNNVVGGGIRRKRPRARRRY